MPGLNLFLVLLLVVTQECAASGYSLLSTTNAVLVAGALGVALALYGLCLGAVRLLGRGLALGPEASAAWTSAAVHALVLVLLILDFVPDPAEAIERLPSVPARAVANYWILAGLSLGAVAVLTPALRRLPVRTVRGFFSFVLVGALAVAVADAFGQSWSSGVAPTAVSTASTSNAAPGPPNVYYIVLDSHGSLQSPPSTTPGAEALHERIRRDYAENDLELHELAYSRYQWTHRSLQSVLDNTANVGHVDKQHGVVTLPKNKLFDQMIGLGYRPIIHGSDYLDLCEAARAGDPRCERYPVGHLGPPLPASQSYPLIVASLLHRLAGGPALAQKSRTFGVINSVLAFEQLIDEVPLHRNAAFVFGHFMLPHEPYILDESCQVDVGEVMRKPYQEYYGRIRLGDAARYWAEYIPQAACTHSLVMKLVQALKEAGLYEETTLIVHGDHGARIRTTRFSGREPAGLPRSQRTRLDFLSAHFAVKPGAFPMQPGSAAGIESWATLDNLLAERMGWPLRSVERRPVNPPEEPPAARP